MLVKQLNTGALPGISSRQPPTPVDIPPSMRYILRVQMRIAPSSLLCKGTFHVSRQNHAETAR